MSSNPLLDFANNTGQPGQVQIGTNPLPGDSPLFTDYNDPRIPNELLVAPNVDKQPQFFLTKVLDVLSRGNYASASLVDTVAAKGIGALGDALRNAGNELIDPQQRLSYSDVITRHAPDFAAAHPWATWTLGLVGDIALDPTTYLGVGLAGKGKKVAGAIISKEGEAVFTKLLGQEVERLAASGAESVATDVARKGFGELLDKGSALVARDSAEAAFTNLIQSSPEMAAKLTQAPGLRFTAFGKDIIGPSITNPILDKIGVTGIVDKLRTTIKESNLAGLLNRDIGLPKEYLDLRSNLTSSLGRIMDDTLDEVGQLFKMPKASREKIGQLGFDIETATKGLSSQLGRSLTDAESLSIKRGIIDNAKLTTGELSTFSSMTQRFKELGDVDQSLDLFSQSMKTLDPELYNIIKKPSEFMQFRQALPSELGQAANVADKANLTNITKGLEPDLMSKWFQDGKQFAGVDGKTYQYGQSLKYLNLTDKSTPEIMSILQARGFQLTNDIAHDAKTGEQIIDKATGKPQVQWIFNHPDGGMVKLTPSADLLKPQDLVKGLLVPKAENDLATEALKVGNDGKLVANSTGEMGKVLGSVDPANMGTLNSWASNVQNSLLGDSFATSLQNVKSKGYVPELDAALLYAQRVSSARRTIAQDMFDSGIKAVYGSLENVPKNVASDIRFMGDGLYGKNLGDASKAALQLYDSFLGSFKTMTTVANPAFSVKRLFSSTFQSFLADGIGTFKTFDPRSLLDGAILSIDKATDGHIIPAFISDWATKFGNEQSIMTQAIDLIRNRSTSAALDGLTIRSALGDTYKGGDVLDLLKQFNVLKGADIRGNIIGRDLSKEVLAKTGDQTFSQMAQAGLNYFKWPSHVEDFARTSLFINGLRQGNSPAAAADLVNKALFDFGNGLSEFERRVATRIVPFYSHQRFVLPLLAETAVTNPGRVAALDKGQKAFLNVWGKINSGDQSLSDSDRRVLPGYLLSQPSSFTGYSDDGKAVFNTFSHFTPLDALGLAEMGDNGSLDLERTVKKTFLSQLTPFLKMPLELATNKEFFTDKAISQSDKVGGIYNYLDKLPQSLQSALDYEKVSDPRTGKPQAYINPYIAYTLSNFIPAINEVVRLTDPNKTAGQAAMDLFTGVKTTKVDLQQSRVYQAKGYQRDIENLIKEVRSAGYEGRQDSMDKKRQDLMDMLDLIKSKY